MLTEPRRLKIDGKKNVSCFIPHTTSAACVSPPPFMADSRRSKKKNRTHWQEKFMASNDMWVFMGHYLLYACMAVMAVSMRERYEDAYVVV